MKHYVFAGMVVIIILLTHEHSSIVVKNYKEMSLVRNEVKWNNDAYIESVIKNNQQVLPESGARLYTTNIIKPLLHLESGCRKIEETQGYPLQLRTRCRSPGLIIYCWFKKIY